MTEPYGLPSGSAINYGALGFPAWVDELCRQWGLDSSTYPGHQESDRPDIGAAPNPSHLNRGIDWTGDPQRMLDFARWCRDNGPPRTPGRYGPPGLEMVIYQDPRNGERVWYPDFVNYGSDFGGHTDHVHTRHSAALIDVAPPPVDLAAILSDAMGGRESMDRYRQLLPAVQQALAECDCRSLERIAMWCAQIGHESAGLHYMEEIADGSAYEGRADLGNTQPGDGRRFKGRGPIQITGRHNYTQLSAWAHSKGLVPSPTFFVDQPAQLASDQYGFLGAVWYWTVARPNINAMCDARDLEGVTRAINGGLNGLDDRRARYNRALAMGDRLVSLTTTVPTDDWEELLANPELERMIREIHHALYELVPSKSRYGDPSITWYRKDLPWNNDGFWYDVITEHDAALGDQEALRRIQHAASAGDGKAAAYLERLTAPPTTAPTQPPPAAAPPAPQPIPQPQPTPRVEYVPVPYTPPKEPDSNGSNGSKEIADVVGDLYRALDALRLADSLSVTERAPLSALIRVLETKNGADL